MDLGNGNTFKVLKSPPDPKKYQHFGRVGPLFCSPWKTFLHYSKKPKRGSAADFMSPKAARGSILMEIFPKL